MKENYTEVEIETLYFDSPLDIIICSDEELEQDDFEQ